jgi:hypothetical protein
VLEASFLNLSDRCPTDAAVSVGPAWKVQEDDVATAWVNVRLAFADGARVDVLAVVCEGCVLVEDVRARPALSLDDLSELAEWLEDPLFDACGIRPEPGADGPDGPRHARPAWPHGIEGRWRVAQEYRAAQAEGIDPVLAVMCATGHSRRRALVLIAQARDAGFLTPRHAPW